MRRYGIILIGLLALTLGSCKRVPPSAYIEFQRTPCFGGCPIYTLKIDGSGMATFEGKRFTEKIGSYSKQLTKEETQKLFNALKEKEWENYKDEYPTRSTDLPSTIFRFHYKKTSKVVVVSGEHPDELDVLSDMLVSIVDSDGWTSSTAE